MHTYTTVGEFTAILTVTDAEGLSNTNQVVINVLVAVDPNPTAVAEADPRTGTVPLNVQFTGSNSTDDGGTEDLTYSWDFGDGNTSSEADPMHTYTTAGEFTAILTVTDADGNTDTDQVTINVVEPTDPNPIAVAEADPRTGTVPLIVQFTGSNSTDDGGTEDLTYSWDFGDGNTSSDADPMHTYTTAGEFTAILTVTDADGNMDTAEVIITVSDPTDPNPIAVAEADPLTGTAPLEVQFTGSNSMDDGGAENLTYAWDFGDGNTSSEADPMHTYTTAGEFTAILTVTDADGNMDTAEVIITVSDPTDPNPIAVAEADPLTGTAPLEVQFTGSNSMDDGGAENLTYSWDFRDGNTSSEADPMHTFTTAGEFTVILTVTDADGNTDTAEVVILVIDPTDPNPIAVAEATPVTGTAPLEVQFTGSNSMDDGGAENLTYAWDFGDGNSSSEADPNHTYTTVGEFTAILTVTDTDGNTDTAEVVITVSDPTDPSDPVAIAEANPITGTVPLTVQFTGSNSTDDGGIEDLSYSWDFGDGNTSVAADPSNTYVTAGEFIAILTVTDGDGNSDTAQVIIRVVDPTNPSPIAVAEADPLTGTAPLEVQFTGSNSIDDGGPENLTYAWDFGDGNSSSEADPMHTFTIAGEYIVNLIVTDASGLTDNDQLTIVVNEGETNVPGDVVTIIDANTGLDLFVLEEGLEIEVSDVEEVLTNIRATIAEDLVVGSVYLELTGPVMETTNENTLPYTLYEEGAGTSLVIGDYTITVTAYSGDNLDGAVLRTIVINFSVINGEITILPRTIVSAQVYPNPATEFVMIEMSEPDAEVNEIVMFDLQGRIIQNYDPEAIKMDDTTYRLDLIGLSNTIYLVRIRVNDTLYFSYPVVMRR